MSDLQIVGEDQLHLDRSAWASPPDKPKQTPGTQARWNANDPTVAGRRNPHAQLGDVAFPNHNHNHDEDHHHHGSTYVAPSQIPSPGRSQYITSNTDHSPQPLSPTRAQRTAPQPVSPANSLNLRLRHSKLSPDPNGNQSTTQTHKSATSQKRTTEMMQGTDTVLSTDSRPAKQMFSPSSQRDAQALNLTSPSQSHGPTRQSTGDDTASPVLAQPGMVNHYQHPTSLSHHVRKQSHISPISSSHNTLPPETPLLKQPATRPITEQQLINEVKGIYAGLVMVERKCVDIINQQTQSNKRLTDQQWKALVALHRTLLQEHHDFFSASQHPTASDNLKKLALKYAMPARMWRHGIHSFLELLRHRLPDSMEHMLSFIYLAYSMMALLKESVPSFVETWIECLGDLARYRMAIEDTDPRDREIWSNVAKMWYNEAADKSPNVGRIAHHLAVLARPNITEQLFYYDKALVSVIPFVNARESIMLLFDMFLKNKDNDSVQSRYPPAEYAFVNTYAILFTRQAPAECDKMLEQFSSTFGGHMDRAGARYKMQGPQMASSLFAGLLDFGKEGSPLWSRFCRFTEDMEAPTKPQNTHLGKPTLHTRQRLHALRQDYWRKLTFDTPVERLPLRQQYQGQEVLESSEAVVAFAAPLTYTNITLVASRMGDKNSIPFMHVVLANLYGMSFVAEALTYIEACIPWVAIILFLNSIGRSGVFYANIESDTFPQSHGGHGRQLPEDFLMRGMTTTQCYYESNFWTEQLVDDDERTIELASNHSPRAERVLWLGVQLAKLGRYITYDYESKMFDTTEFARSLGTAYV